MRTRWGTPKDYAWLYRASLTDQYRTGLLFWLQWDAPPGLYGLVLKELRREDRKERPDSYA